MMKLFCVHVYDQLEDCISSSARSLESGGFLGGDGGNFFLSDGGGGGAIVVAPSTQTLQHSSETTEKVSQS